MLLLGIIGAIIVLWAIAMVAAFMGGSSESCEHRSGGNHWLDWML